MSLNNFEPYLDSLKKAIRKLDRWRSDFGEDDADPGDKSTLPEIDQILEKLAGRLEGNYPFHHPIYAGQMLKPPHPVAWLAYALTMTINPNNHALDGGPPTSEMEKEVVAKLAGMVGYGKTFLGHLSSAGTIANLEALWIAREIHPGNGIASSQNAHYTHSRMCSVLGVKHLTFPVDETGAPDMNFLDQHKNEIGTLVVTLGTTGLGVVEPLHELLPWARKNGIRVHVDAAYGGFFKLIAGTHGIDANAWDKMGEADSIVIDPHKHGLQPYGCGSILFKDPAVGKYYKHDSPYTYFTSEELHLGEISLECSRAGASAAALWATLEMLPLQYEDGLGDVLSACRRAALNFADACKASDRMKLYCKPELDIVGYFPEPDHNTVSAVSDASKKWFKEKMDSGEFYSSLYRLPASHFAKLHPDYKADEESVTILRSTFMKPEHEQMDFSGILSE